MNEKYTPCHTIDPVVRILNEQLVNMRLEVIFK